MAQAASRERPGRSVKGRTMVVLGAVLVVVLVAAIALAFTSGWWLIVAGLALLAALLLVPGFYTVQPNQTKVLTLFGRYTGSVSDEGLRWSNPFQRRATVSLRVRNLDSDSLKVNDAVGNPVEIAAVINWQVVDSFRALFEVDRYEDFVQLQTEAAIRHVASAYPYDDFDEGEASLRANADDVTLTLQNELQQRLQVAGVSVLDCRLRRLAYAPEIAGEMLRRQQANAVVAARTRIVEGAVGMVDHALQMLSEQGIVVLDEERKAAMVSNLMVVLCSERGAQPVVNAGTLYGG